MLGQKKGCGRRRGGKGGGGVCEIQVYRAGSNCSTLSKSRSGVYPLGTSTVLEFAYVIFWSQSDDAGFWPNPKAGIHFGIYLMLVQIRLNHDVRVFRVYSPKGSPRMCSARFGIYSSSTRTQYCWRILRAEYSCPRVPDAPQVEDGVGARVEIRQRQSIFNHGSAATFA